MKHPDNRRRVRAFVLIAALLVPVLLLGGGAVILGALMADVRTAYLDSIVGTGNEPAFLLTLAFLCTFGVVRLVTYSIHYQTLPFFEAIQKRVRGRWASWAGWSA